MKSISFYLKRFQRYGNLNWWNVLDHHIFCLFRRTRRIDTPAEQWISETCPRWHIATTLHAIFKPRHIDTTKVFTIGKLSWCGRHMYFPLSHTLSSSPLQHSRTTVRVCDVVSAWCRGVLSTWRRLNCVYGSGRVPPRVSRKLNCLYLKPNPYIHLKRFLGPREPTQRHLDGSPQTPRHATTSVPTARICATRAGDAA